MGKKCFKVLSTSLLAAGLIFFGGCSCNAGKVKVTFVTEQNSDIVRYVKKGKSIIDMPTPPEVKGKYCEWDRSELKNINEDTVVTAICHQVVTNLYTNIADEISVDVSSQEADLSYIFKDIELEATFETGEKKKLYDGDYVIDTKGYNKDVGGSYVVSIKYNNAKKDIKINVKRKTNYLSVSLDGGFGYYNEGLPDLTVNTDVDGVISYDPGQSLYVGNKSYNWTFIPTDRDKYDIVKGSVEVRLYSAGKLRANKSALTVEYGTSKTEIIEMIKEGLVVEAEFGNSYRVIDPKYYTIECDEFVEDKGNTYTFKIIYDTIQNAHPISVTVEKCKDYELNVNNVNSYIIKENSDLSDVIEHIQVSSNIPGTISFKENQTLVAGTYEYEYIFTPGNINYAPREGKIRISAYKAIELNYQTIEEFAYGSDKESIIMSLKNNITGNVIYNDSYEVEIDKSKVNITLSNSFNSTTIGLHHYVIEYNGEITYSGTFNINKRVLIQGVDFDYECGEVDDLNPEVLPICKIIKLNNELDIDISNLFEVVQLSFNDLGEGNYRYEAELIPDNSISDVYASVIIVIELSIN